MTSIDVHPGSFRDPSGFIFLHQQQLYRQVNQRFAANYDLLMKSGLYDDLVAKNLLVSHSEIQESLTKSNECYKTLRPEKVFFISYPYEWCFEELKDAALLTLKILRLSLNYGMILKDASPYNVQLHRGKPIFIDTLSFEKYNPDQPWVAYRQFCKNFLFPLYLEHYLNADIQKLLMAYPDGIPVDLTSKLLPLKSGLNLGVWLHVYLQNTVRGNDKPGKETGSFNKKKLVNMITHLEGIVKGFGARDQKTEWSHYYSETILGKDYLDAKETVFRSLLSNIKFETALDLGANDGYFSKILAEGGADVIATDYDSRTISNLYQFIRKKNITNIHPVVLDLSSPSPSLGFNNRERASFSERARTQLVVALALIHHLVIGRNIPLRLLASYFNEIAPELIMEFVPKSDEKVQQMLSTREDVFEDYTQDVFEKEFFLYFDTVSKISVPHSHRTMYHFKRKPREHAA